MRRTLIALAALAAVAFGTVVVALPAEASPCRFTYCAPVPPSQCRHNLLGHCAKMAPKVEYRKPVPLR